MIKKNVPKSEKVYLRHTVSSLNRGPKSEQNFRNLQKKFSNFVKKREKMTKMH